jgi:hypothetical protein
LNFSGELSSSEGELSGHCRGDVDHLEPLPLKSDFLDNFPCEFYSSFSVDITFQVMAISNQSACNYNGVRPVFKGA